MTTSRRFEVKRHEAVCCAASRLLRAALVFMSTVYVLCVLWSCVTIASCVYYVYYEVCSARGLFMLNEGRTALDTAPARHAIYFQSARAPTVSAA